MEVTVISTSPSKREEALERLGADKFVVRCAWAVPRDTCRGRGDLHLAKLRGPRLCPWLRRGASPSPFTPPPLFPTPPPLPPQQERGGHEGGGQQPARHHRHGVGCVGS